ncbi:hypothetical protein ARALYDRAFT_920263 [Arabidopsis lyrata subsp. lyrata]|uniref:Uncharacterized protein n=1 Tax=Arabidopsis lyrata subsp. lyrata TaxID=81972 RepID=D7MWN0_ARALL|nr:hypothetical protein ARALYDRAFT_920263 [Arabidopsis lyrata subsp. lyrata]
MTGASHRRELLYRDEIHGVRPRPTKIPIKSRHVFITSGSSGIGLALAQRTTSDGVCVSILAKSSRNRQWSATFYLVKHSPEDVKFTIDVNQNLVGSFNVNKAHFPSMTARKDRGSASITLVSSQAGQFPLHNLTAEAVWLGLFVDNHGEYWDVPLSMAIDLASLPAESGPSYHLCLHHNSGSPKKLNSDTMEVPPPSLLPCLSLTSAISYWTNMDLWRGTTPKLETYKPYDVFLSSPHVAVSGIIGMISFFDLFQKLCDDRSIGENSIRSKFENDSEGVGGFSLHFPFVNSGFMADTLGLASLTAQYRNFQKLFFDLTRFHARLDFPYGLRFLTGATSVSQDLLNSRQPSLEAFQKICPEVLVSLQQQIVGPSSFKVESGIQIDLKNGVGANPVTVDKTVFAIEYALQVLLSAKAVAWYSPKQKEFMVELSFFET